MHITQSLPAETTFIVNKPVYQSVYTCNNRERAVNETPSRQWTHNTSMALETQLQQHSSDADAYVRMGDLRLEQGNYAEALTAYEAALGIDPNCVDAYVGCGDALLAEQRYIPAMTAYTTAILIHPSLAHAHLGRGMARCGFCEDARGPLADFTEAIHCDPYLVEAYLQRAELRAAWGDYIGAVADYDQILCLEPEHHVAFQGRQQALDAKAEANKYGPRLLPPML